MEHISDTVLGGTGLLALAVLMLPVAGRMNFPYTKLFQMPSYPPIGLSTGKLLANIARSTPMVSMVSSMMGRMLSVVP